MCGIIGMLVGGKRPTTKITRADFMEQALYVDALRGLDSTGIFYVGHNKEAVYIKEAIPASNFLAQKAVQKVLGESAKAHVVVGHNRYGTVGGSDYSSAHPFVTDNVLLVHNGTLKTYKDMPTHPTSDTDSARIAQALSEADPEGAKEIIENLNGAFALVWHDLRNDTLNIAKNDERPLSFISLDDNTMYFASEGAMLSWLLYRSGVAAAIYKSHAFPLDEIYSYQITKKGIDTTRPQKTKWQTAVVPKTVHAPGFTYYNSNGNVDSWDVQPDTAQKDAGRQEERNKFLKSKGIFLEIGEAIEVMSGGVVPYTEFGNKGRDNGWFDTDVHFSLVTEKFKGELYCDVHQVPVQCNGSELEVDSYEVVIRGVKKEADKKEKNITLLGVYSTYLMHKHVTDYWDDTPILKEFFDGKRWKLSDKDRAYQIHPCYNDALFTRREVEEWTNGKKCNGCGIPATLVPTHDIRFTKRLKQGFVCADCFKKAA